MGRWIKDANSAWREPEGFAALWLWFGLSHAGWLTLVLLHGLHDSDIFGLCGKRGMPRNRDHESRPPGAPSEPMRSLAKRGKND